MAQWPTRVWVRDTHSKSAEMVPINPVPGPGSASAPYLTASKWAHHCEFSGSGAGAGTIENISSGVPPRYFCILHIVSTFSIFCNIKCMIRSVPCLFLNVRQTILVGCRLWNLVDVCLDEPLFYFSHIAILNLAAAALDSTKWISSSTSSHRYL